MSAAPDTPGKPSQTAFDAAAPRYDADSTEVVISRWLRERVWAWLAELFPPGAHVLELGCGTGEDALWLARRGVNVTATDVSTGMLAQARAKFAAACETSPELAGRVAFCELDLADAARWDVISGAPDGLFDGAFSNYGPLNCIGDWQALGAALARAVRPGGVVGVAVMGRFCLWESLWHGLHGDLGTAARRWRGRVVATIDGVSFPVYYPTPARMARDFGPAFRRRRLMGLGVCLPPSDVYGAVARRARLARLLRRAEHLTAGVWPFPYMADHYWLELTRADTHTP